LPPTATASPNCCSKQATTLLVGIQNLIFPMLSKDDKGRERIEIKPEKIGNRIREEIRNSLPRLVPIIQKQIDTGSKLK
jgi:hypothetical protein